MKATNYDKAHAWSECVRNKHRSIHTVVSLTDMVTHITTYGDHGPAPTSYIPLPIPRYWDMTKRQYVLYALHPWELRN